jgi:hypothetical protein
MSSTLSLGGGSMGRSILGSLDMAHRGLSCRLEEGCFLRRFIHWEELGTGCSKDGLGQDVPAT